MEVNCPSCSYDNAYFDCVNYVCPDCDYTWSDEYISQNETDDGFFEEKYYNCFVKVEKGVKYSCNYGPYSDIKDMIIVPLAKDLELYTQYILLEAAEVEKLYPDLYEKVISMNLKTLESSLKTDEFKEIKKSILYVRTGRLNTFLDYLDSNRQFYQIKKID
jgi:hypothetical protein